MNLPPHIGWPLFVIGLLLLSMSTAFSALYFAGSDGGAQLVPDYYQKAQRYEAHLTQQSQNVRLGWQLTLSVLPPSDGVGKRPIRLEVRDAEGVPLRGLTGTVTTFRPHRSGPLEVQAWHPAAEEGTYGQTLQLDAPGLWDFQITLTYAGQRFVQTLRREVAGP